MNSDVLSYISKNEQYNPLLNRLTGTLNAMVNEPPPDRMHLLIPTGHVDQDHIAAWKKLRNRFVHPKEVDLKKLSSERLQEFMDELHKVTGLMYHIVFYNISYTGRYTDYATFGFPEKTFPLTIELPPSQST